MILRYLSRDFAHLSSHPRELDFGAFRAVSVHFGSVSGPFRVRLGVLGRVGVGSFRGGSVREKNITSIDTLEYFVSSQRSGW